MELCMLFYFSPPCCPCAQTDFFLGDKHEVRKYTEITFWRDDPNPGGLTKEGR